MRNQGLTAHVTITDAEIRRQAATSVRQLRDPRFPELFFRFSSVDRSRGSWHVAVRGKWGKAGSFPGIGAKLMQSTLPEILARRAADPEATSTTSSWRTTGQVLAWYGDRMGRDRGLSKKRKASAQSALRCHLAPRLQELELISLDRPTLDRLLMWPLQERYELSFVRSVYGVLAAAFRQAARVGMLSANPMAGFKFTDFVRTKIRPKSARLRGDDLPALLQVLAEQFEAQPLVTVLPVLMLCHGTRLGETRLARWKNVNLDARRWFIPAADTKTKVEHTLPLTDQACALLRRYRELQAASGYSGPFLFPGSNGRALSASKASTVFTSVATGEWSSHDLRKVARTAWADLGVDYMVGEMLLNHAMKDLDATYIHTTAEGLKRKALEAWHQHLDQQGFARLHGRTFIERESPMNTMQASESVASSVITHPSQGRSQNENGAPEALSGDRNE